MKTKIVHLTNQEILGILSKLEKTKRLKDISLPIKLLWELKKDIKKLEDVKKQFISMSSDIEKQYSDDEHSNEIKRENGDIVREVKKKYLEEFVQKKAELLDVENDLELSLFSIDELGDADFTLEAIDALSPFIDDAD